MWNAICSIQTPAKKAVLYNQGWALQVGVECAYMRFIQFCVCAGLLSCFEACCCSLWIFSHNWKKPQNKIFSLERGNIFSVGKCMVLRKNLFNSVKRLVYLYEVQYIVFHIKEGRLLHFVSHYYFCSKRIIFSCFF